MKKLFATVVAAVMAVSTIVPVHAGSYGVRGTVAAPTADKITKINHRRHWRSGHRHHRHHHRHDSGNALAAGAAGFIVGTIIGNVLSQPRQQYHTETFLKLPPSFGRGRDVIPARGGGALYRCLGARAPSTRSPHNCDPDLGWRAVDVKIR